MIVDAGKSKEIALAGFDSAHDSHSRECDLPALFYSKRPSRAPYKETKNVPFASNS